MLDDYNIFLASGSPRRRELLALLGVDFRIADPISVEERVPDGLPAAATAGYLARLKADAYMSVVGDGDIYITADTIVLLDDDVMGKPSSLDDARMMLRRLSGRTHKVITGVCIFDRRRIRQFESVTEVEFACLRPEDIDSYVERFRPLDKAGAYGIQEQIGAIGVKGIHGSFYNVMGLPVHKLYEELREFSSELRV